MERKYRLMSGGVEVEPIQYLASCHGTPGDWVEVRCIRRHYLSWPSGGSLHDPLPDTTMVETRKLWIEDWTEQYLEEIRKQETSERLEYWWLQ